MPPKKTNLLIVEDDISIRKLLSDTLAESGYKVRSTEDGFSALVELRGDIPNILLSDLNMPGMSGFELLSVVRRRFPAIPVIAMSGAFSGEGVPPGVVADAFYEKGTGLQSLLQIIESTAHLERLCKHPETLAPIWIPRNGLNLSGEAYIVVNGPECLRTFSQPLDRTITPIRETNCVHCHSLIYYAIVQAADPISLQTFQRKPGTRMATPLGVPDTSTYEE